SARSAEALDTQSVGRDGAVGAASSPDAQVGPSQVRPRPNISTPQAGPRTRWSIARKSPCFDQLARSIASGRSGRADAGKGGGAFPFARAGNHQLTTVANPGSASRSAQ